MENLKHTRFVNGLPAAAGCEGIERYPHWKSPEGKRGGEPDLSEPRDSEPRDNAGGVVTPIARRSSRLRHHDAAALPGYTRATLFPL